LTHACTINAVSVLAFPHHCQPHTLSTSHFRHPPHPPLPPPTRSRARTHARTHSQQASCAPCPVLPGWQGELANRAQRPRRATTRRAASYYEDGGYGAGAEGEGPPAGAQPHMRYADGESVEGGWLGQLPAGANSGEEYGAAGAALSPSRRRRKPLVASPSPVPSDVRLSTDPDEVEALAALAGLPSPRAAAASAAEDGFPPFPPHHAQANGIKK
jgi:hypothetical protein